MKVKRNVTLVLVSFAFLVFWLFSAAIVQASAPCWSESGWFQVRLELTNQSQHVRQAVIKVEKSPSAFEGVRKNVTMVRSFRWSESGWVRVRRDSASRFFATSPVIPSQKDSPSVPEKVREETPTARVFRWSDANWRTYRRVREDLKVLPPSIPVSDEPEADVDEPEVDIDESEADVDELGASADERIILELTNKERVARGLPALIFDPELSRVARIKSQDMIDNNYFLHTSPTYGSPFEMMRHFGIKYSYAGENIAKAFSPQSAVALFMQSSGHRASILNTRS